MKAGTGPALEPFGSGELELAYQGAAAICGWMAA